MWGTLYVEFFTQLLWFVIPFANQVFQLKKEKNRKQDRCQRWELLPTTIDHHRRSNPTLTSPTDTLCSGQNTLLCRFYKWLDCFGFNFMFCAQTSCYSRLQSVTLLHHTITWWITCKTPPAAHSETQGKMINLCPQPNPPGVEITTHAQTHRVYLFTPHQSIRPI